jgi:hypothetical protein
MPFVRCDTCRCVLEFGTDWIGASRERCGCNAGRWRAVQRVTERPIVVVSAAVTRRTPSIKAIPCAVCGRETVTRTLRKEATATPPVRFCSMPCRNAWRRERYSRKRRSEWAR